MRWAERVADDVRVGGRLSEREGLTLVLLLGLNVWLMLQVTDWYAEALEVRLRESTAVGVHEGVWDGVVVREPVWDAAGVGVREREEVPLWDTCLETERVAVEALKVPEAVGEALCGVLVDSVWVTESVGVADIRGDSDEEALVVGLAVKVVRVGERVTLGEGLVESDEHESVAEGLKEGAVGLTLTLWEGLAEGEAVGLPVPVPVALVVCEGVALRENVGVPVSRAVRDGLRDHVGVQEGLGLALGLELSECGVRVSVREALRVLVATGVGLAVRERLGVEVRVRVKVAGLGVKVLKWDRVPVGLGLRFDVEVAVRVMERRVAEEPDIDVVPEGDNVTLDGVRLGLGVRVGGLWVAVTVGRSVVETVGV